MNGLVQQVNSLILLTLFKPSVVCTLVFFSERHFLIVQNLDVEDIASNNILVHEFCKLQSKTGGRHGIPEYGHGGVAFLSLNGVSKEASYCQQCAEVKMKIQVGSRYFVVSAANSGKVLFLELP